MHPRDNRRAINRIVFAILLPLLIALSAPATAGNPLSAAAKLKMKAMIGPYGFYPSTIPSGLLFITWKTNQLTPRACGLNLDITFAGDGKHLDWSSSRDCGATASPACYNNGYPGYDFEMDASQTARINGRRVYFSPGNHGSNAWACIPLTIGGFKDMAVVGIWESNFMTPQQAMSLVAHARPF
jgi:hypothetical protein